MHDGVQAFSAGMHQGSDRQLQLAIFRVLFSDGQCVRLNQGKAELHHVLVFDAAVNRVKPDPASGFRSPVADRRADIIRIFSQGGDQFSRRSVVYAL